MNAKVAREYTDEGGYWIDLTPGWVLAGEDTHSIVENTRAEARAKLAEVVACRCDECRPKKEGK